MNIHGLRAVYKGKEFIPYAEFLRTDEWKEKREIITTRDGCRCTKCGHLATIDHYDIKQDKTLHFWIEHDGCIINVDGFEEPDFNPVLADKAYHLEVHHNRYILNRLPWEYNNEDLVTFCNHCHTDFHKNNTVYVYSEDELTKLDYEICNRCNGYGYLPEYRHVQNGVCFQCMGERYTQPLIKRNS